MAKQEHDFAGRLARVVATVQGWTMPTAGLGQRGTWILRSAYLAVGAVFIADVLFGLRPHAAGDTHIFWANGLPDPYTIRSYSAGDGYFYSPAFAQLFEPLRHLPFPVVGAIWTAMQLAVLYWLVGRWAVVWLLFLPVTFEIYFGNVNLLFAVVAAAGERLPWTWALVLLTKVTPGVGLVWFAMRREWRLLAIALGTTFVVVAVSLLLAPNLWSDWVALLASNTDASGGYPVGPLWIRLPLAGLLVAWGARTNRRWVLPVGMLIAAPRVWLASAAVLAALPRLLARARTPIRADETPRAAT